MPALRVEVAFSVGARTSMLLQLDDPTRGILGRGTLGDGTPLTPVWTDITPWVRTGTIRRGAQRVDTPIVDYEAGTCSVVLDNTDRRFDPSNLAGPYVAGGATQVTAMRAVRIRAQWDGTFYELFRGFVDSWNVEWLPPNYSECTMSATDGFKVLSGVDRAAVPTVGAGEDAGARISRILDSAGWSMVDREISAGETRLQGTTLEGDALDEIRLTTMTELGESYIDAGGRFVFRDRNALLNDARSNTPVAVWGDGAGELPYVDLAIATDDVTFYNDVRVTRVDGVEQSAQDTASQATYYRRTYSPSESLPLETDTDARNYAQWLLHISSDPELRFTEITVNPRSDPGALFPRVLGGQLGDRITVIRRPPGGGDPIQRDQFVRGVEHEFSAAQWATKWTLQDAEKFGSFLTLDNPVLGVLDANNALAY